MSEAGPAAPPPKNKPAATRFKPGLHPRNRDIVGYDFPALAAASPGLARYLVTTPAGSVAMTSSVIKAWMRSRKAGSASASLTNS